HHFPPEKAGELLQDAVERHEGIGVFEATQRSVPAILAMLIAVLLVFFCTPFIRPFRISLLVWTYLLPAVPLIVLFDGIVSCLRTYTPAELMCLVDGVPNAAEAFHWEAGEAAPIRGGLPVTFLIGYPRAETA